jgi:hypothetical protein
MFSITKTYTDYNGIEKTETFWFNLNQRELSQLALGPSGGLDGVISEIVSTNDMGRTMELLEEIVLSAYGKKMPDGRFAKTDDDGHRYADHFKQTAVYDESFMDLLLDVNKLIAFVNGVVPAGLKESVEKASAEAQERIAQLEARVSAEREAEM